MAMKPYVIKQGDFVSKLAYLGGFVADDVWNASENADLKASRPSMDVLYPGDVLYVPDATPEPQPVNGGTSNDYAADVPGADVELVFTDDKGPIANEDCSVEGLSGGGAETKTTDGDGKLQLKVPYTLREFTITFTAKELAFNVQIGDMDPLAEQAGVVKRLQNLGYLPDMTEATEDDVAEMLPVALASFQIDKGLTPTGELDDATRKAIGDAHGV